MTPTTIAAPSLRRFIAALFEHAGIPVDDAATVADCLVTANLRGVDTHGVFRVPTYLERVRRGIVNTHPDILVTPVSGAVAMVDGDNGMGAVVGTRAMQRGIELAREAGIGLVSVRRSTHYGMAAYYVLQAIKGGMIGMAFTNASPALPPWGGRAPFFGTSPLAIGVPGGKRSDFVLDMAMSVLARGNVYIAAQNGESIAPGLALDADGYPTTDPNDVMAGGTMLPFGGVKGAALAAVMDIFGGVLSGAAFAGTVGNPHTDFTRSQDVGHLFIVIRPDLFMPRDAFADRMDVLIERMKTQPRAAGFDEILVPGEREARAARDRGRNGIPLSAEVTAALQAEAEAAGIAFPDAVAHTSSGARSNG